MLSCLYTSLGPQQPSYCQPGSEGIPDIEEQDDDATELLNQPTLVSVLPLIPY